jgi:serpin B
MLDAFDRDHADFSGIADRRVPLCVDVAAHRCVVAVDEDGTEAAAATFLGVVFKRMRREDRPRVFQADHPFLFLIRQRSTDSILFIGRVVDPSAHAVVHW